MIALIRKNLRLWGYGKSLALFAGCILFSISGRLNGGIAYERHILSAVSDHYYLTYFVLPIVLLSCFSFIDDDGEPVILRFQSYHSYFLKKWIGAGLIAVILTAVQTGAILLSGIGLIYNEVLLTRQTPRDNAIWCILCAAENNRTFPKTHRCNQRRYPKKS